MKRPAAAHKHKRSRSLASAGGYKSKLRKQEPTIAELSLKLEETVKKLDQVTEQFDKLQKQHSDLQLRYYGKDLRRVKLESAE
jgi:uncharacterized coiled-coil protein SlyX